MKLKLKMPMKILAAIKKMFDLSNYSTKLKYYDNSNKSVVGKIKDETASVAIEESVGLKPKMYSYLIMIIVSIEKQKVWMETLLRQYVLTNVKMFC